jgi:hypothetical protein
MAACPSVALDELSLQPAHQPVCVGTDQNIGTAFRPRPRQRVAEGSALAGLAISVGRGRPGPERSSEN